MDDTIIKAIIGLVGIIAGGIITAISSAFSAKQKIRELEVKHRQQLKDNYLGNARAYTSVLYVPISIALTNLIRQYEIFRKDISFDSDNATDVSTDSFLSACAEYIETMLNLYSRGADAFLTTELDERLRSFNNFIKASLDADEPIRKAVLSYKIRVPGVPRLSTEKTLEKQLKGIGARALRSAKISVGFLGVGITYRSEEILAASVTSREFEERMLNDILELKYLIKEVTLGTHAK